MIAQGIPQVKGSHETAWLRGYFAGLQDCHPDTKHDQIMEAAKALAKTEGMNLVCTGCGRRYYSAASVADLTNKNCDCGAPLVGVPRG